MAGGAGPRGAIIAPATRKRLGFLAGHILVPKDFDRMGRKGV